MVLGDLSDSDKDDNITISQLAKESKADSSIAPPGSDSKPPSLSKSKVLWEPPKVVVETDVRVKVRKMIMQQVITLCYRIMCLSIQIQSRIRSKGGWKLLDSTKLF